MRLRQIYIFIAMIAAGLAVQAVLASPATAATYETHGTATSTNLLSGSSASSITNFHYNLSYLPATSSVTIQFSNDSLTWYSAANVSGGSTTLSLSPTGGTDLSLSALGWSGTAFYYKMTINSTSTQSDTPTIDDIRLDYTPTSGYENVFVFDNYGNVGIGTTSPSGKLDIHGAGTGTGVNTQWSDLTGAAKVTILDNGNVGIGTTAPTGILDIAGGVKIGAGYAGIGTTAPANGLLVQGNVGIGTTSPGNKLAVSGGVGIGTTAPGSAYLSTKAPDGGLIVEGNVGIGTTAPGQALDVIGDMRTNGCIYYNSGTLGTCASDARLKKNIDPLAFSGALEKVMGLQPKTFSYKNDPARIYSGLVAQDVQQVAPELVTTGSNGYLQVKYGDVQWLTIEAIQQQQGMIIQQQVKNTDQDTAIADVNLKTSQNVETVGQLQKSVDDNLTVISSNFSAVDTKLALHDSAMANVNSQIASLGTEVSAINTRLTSLDTQTAAIVSQVSDLNGNMSLNEAEKADLVSRLSAAEDGLKKQENNLGDMENKFLKELNTSYELLNGNDKLLGSRIDALEAKLATMTITAAGEIPAKDASGNAILAGIFEAKSVVAGAFSVKNEKDSSAPTMGDAEIVSVKVDVGQDGWDDVTKVDGKSVRVKTEAVSETAKIFVSFENDPGARYWVEKIRDADKKLTGSFSINVSDPVKKDTKFSWWIVEEK